MTKWLVGDGVGPGGNAGYGPTWWVNHRFLPQDATFMGDGSILRGPGSDHTALCGEEFACLNAASDARPDCTTCEEIAERMGAS